MARELGIRPANAVMVGDSRRSDYDGAKAVGMGAVLLRRSGKDCGTGVIKSLQDLPGEIRLLPGQAADPVPAFPSNNERRRLTVPCGIATRRRSLLADAAARVSPGAGREPGPRYRPEPCLRSAPRSGRPKNH